jgi:hypothetical protein
MPHSAKATTPLGRAIAIATSANFVIRPSHARARLDVNSERIVVEQRVLCGALDGHGRYTCGEHIASVGLRGEDIGRALIMEPGWISEGNFWYPTKNLCYRQAHGQASRYRRPHHLLAPRTLKGPRQHTRRYVRRLPAVAVCCLGHINILEANRLAVATEEGRARADEQAMTM